jgi:hypothetical protein
LPKLRKPSTSLPICTIVSSNESQEDVGKEISFNIDNQVLDVGDGWYKNRHKNYHLTFKQTPNGVRQWSGYVSTKYGEQKSNTLVAVLKQTGPYRSEYTETYHFEGKATKTVAKSPFENVMDE